MTVLIMITSGGTLIKHSTVIAVSPRLV